MISTLVAMVLVLNGAVGVLELAPGDTMNWSVVLANADGEPCDTNLWRVHLIRATNPQGTANVEAVAQLPGPSPTGFDETGNPYTVTFENVTQDGMVEGVVYYFFAILEDETAIRSLPGPPSEDVVLQGTPPSPVGTAVFRVEVTVVVPVPE